MVSCVVWTAVLALGRGTSRPLRAQLLWLVLPALVWSPRSQGPVPVARAVAANVESVTHWWPPLPAVRLGGEVWSESKALSSPSQLPEREDLLLLC